MKTLSYSFLFFILIVFNSFILAQQNNFITIKNQKFIDGKGRQILLKGVNYMNKNSDEKHHLSNYKNDFSQFRKWGINCIRLGVFWDVLEPDPGKYNEEYLTEIDEILSCAKDNEIYVYLDMHQDLYGQQFSDGAPDWATITEGKPHLKGDIWSDSYLLSPAVQTAFDNFWKNALAPDGTGLQDHYANLWGHIAKRYANNSTVIGYDIMNEPFMGSEANKIIPIFLNAYAKLVANETGKVLDSMKLVEIWSSTNERMKALEFLSTKERYAKIINSIYEVNANFERNVLQKMYQKMGDAIREFDKNHILFLNHNYFCNMGVASALEPLKFTDGTIDIKVAYSAHGYDLVVDTKQVENQSFERVAYIFEQIAQTGKRLNMPVLIGEWGAFYGKSQQLTTQTQQVLTLFTKYQFSNTYWSFYKGIDQDPYFIDGFVTPYPQFISGNLKIFNYDYESKKFRCHWNLSKNTKEPIEIYVPNLSKLIQKNLKITPNCKLKFKHFSGSNSGQIVVFPEKKGEYSIEF